MKIPYHVAVIMDGNGRWAKKKNLPRTVGHKKGMDRIEGLIKAAKKTGVKVLTVFAFSSENWSRPKDEIKALFSYLAIFLKNYRGKLMREKVKVNFIGRRDRIGEEVIKKIKKLEEETANNNSLIFNICLDYSGRWDIINAVNKIIHEYQKDSLKFDLIDEDVFAKYLNLNEIPDPDLLIRTSGEQRISNFLLWNLAYSELYFTNVLWPDFDESEFVKAIEAYSQRTRRFGAV